MVEKQRNGKRMRKCRHKSLIDLGLNLNDKTFVCKNRKCKRRFTFEQVFASEKSKKDKR